MMLQQTQVETVLPYYQRWMERFPSIASVAQAPLESVLKAWEGLGYYSRARNLHKAAQAVVRKHGGKLPEDPEALRELPGIGPYSAGAIASIAYNRPAPMVDGNVARVIARWLALEEEVTGSSGRGSVWDATSRMLVAAVGQGGQPRRFNQALIELGALICRPRSPQCLLCPWQESCRARTAGDPEAYPRKADRKARPVRRGVMLMACRETEAGEAAWLIRLRPPRGIWGGLWEFPWIEHQAEEESVEALCSAILQESGAAAAARAAAHVGHVSHGLTHFQLELDCMLLPVDAPDGSARATREPYRWANRQEIARLPLARLSHKVLALLDKHYGRLAHGSAEAPRLA